MKKYYIYILTAVLPILWGACNNAMILTPSIVFFQQSQWNIMVLMNGCLLIIHIRITLISSIVCKILKVITNIIWYRRITINRLLWPRLSSMCGMEAYTELAGPAFLRSYVPKTFHLIGSPAYDSSGTKVLGTAEGGKKITLYEVNSLDFENVDIEVLNEYYFKTMHHEFAHILHQKRNYDPSFDRITEGKYVGSDWYFYVAENGNSYLREDADAWPEGFVTAYAMSEAREDFVENIAMYVTHDQAYWDNMLKVAGTAGAAIINQKFTIVYNYMLETWGINLDDLREIVLRRQQEIPELDLSTIE